MHLCIRQSKKFRNKKGANLVYINRHGIPYVKDIYVDSEEEETQE